jgi:Ca2+-binding RTX toxin-like protein
MKTLFFGPDQAMADLNESNVSLVATGNHFMFVGGSFDTIMATGGMQFITAPMGHNTITTGASDDYLFVAGGSNVIDAGAGANTIYDMANPGDTLVMPTAGQGFDTIILTPGADPTLAFHGVALSDLRATASGSTTVVSVGSTAVASIANIAGPQWDLNTVLAHAIT